MTPIHDTIKELRKLCAEATPAPWKPNTWVGMDTCEWTATGPLHGCSEDDDLLPGCNAEQLAEADARFLVAAREHLPRTIDALEVAVKRLEKIASVTSDDDHLGAKQALESIETLLKRTEDK